MAGGPENSSLAVFSRGAPSSSSSSLGSLMSRSWGLGAWGPGGLHTGLWRAREAASGLLSDLPSASKAWLLRSDLCQWSPMS